MLQNDEIIKYRFYRAKETIEEAKLLASDNRWNTCVNRLYYACFYAVIGLLFKKGLKSKSHSGARTLFTKEFIKTGQVANNYGILYGDLFNKRQESDYKDLQRFTQADIAHLIPQAEEFIEAIKNLVKIA